MKKRILLIGLLAIAILLSGCVQSPVCGNGIVEIGEKCDQSYCGATSECIDCECVTIEEPDCGLNPACVEDSECPGFIGPLRIGERYTPVCENGCCDFDYTPPTDGDPAQPNPPIDPSIPLDPSVPPFLPLQPIQ
ncbi:MAG: hypothetical protein QGI60_02860 [archaeon]|jgi:hypothetical protein|nr:hypothetical protein [archaeon]